MLNKIPDELQNLGFMLTEKMRASKIWVYPESVQKPKNICIGFEGLRYGIYTVTLLTTNGDKILEYQIDINCDFQSMEIETPDLPNGLYIIHVFSDEETFIQRIIIQQ